MEFLNNNSITLRDKGLHEQNQVIISIGDPDFHMFVKQF